MSIDPIGPLAACSSAGDELGSRSRGRVNVGDGWKAASSNDAVQCLTVLLHQSVLCSPPVGRGNDVNHGIVDVFAFQEALLIEAVFGIALLAMVWVGFRRWLRHKEEMGRLMAQNGSAIERVEARLQAIEQALADGRVQMVPDQTSTPQEVHHDR